tara:strand:- start:42 stop:524 length:483 start_codon:yes stop_codon:yes gene_type:complete
MTDKSVMDMINQIGDKWIKKEYLGDDIFKCISDGKEYDDDDASPSTYLVMPKRAGILDMGGDFHIVTNPQYRGKGLAERLIQKWIDYRKPKICGEDKDGYITHTSCTTGADGCDKDSQPIIEHLLKKCGFKFTDNKWKKCPFTGERYYGDETMKWRYFYK